MAVPTPKVEIGFELTDSGTGPYLRLDDPVAGRLDDPNWVLGGDVLVDVTDRVRSISIARGKNRELDTFEAGLANVVFNNQDRAFDPEFTASPFFGQIVPRRTIRISSAGQFLFYGVIDDWNLNYDPNNDNTASAACSDAFGFFNSQTLTGGTATAQKTGERINAILSSADVEWPVSERNVETGVQDLGADVIEDGTNALEYLRTVAASEPGAFFIGGNGHVVFRDRYATGSSGGVTLTDDGTGIPYFGMKVVYGSELLYNEIVIGSNLGGTAVALDTDSIGEFGVRNLTQTNLLMSQPSAVTDLANWYAQKYSQPEFRFEEVSVQVDQLTPTQQAAILALELGDVVEIRFTPGNVPPAIVKYGEVIRIDSSIDPINHVVSLGFATTDVALLVLDDLVFGRLDRGNALAF